MKMELTINMPQSNLQNQLLTEIQVAECIFNMALTPKEVESAIYRLNSAELKYKAFILLEKDTNKIIN